ncbi:hypothetical protein D7Y21_07730 [Corallococcus sp. AB045]|uniref:hypothetical protein n=1 Tax=Corallococcus sp. AB045 TaxID=2316719 RepID=UPI000EF0AADB|nr:hypothetical protein [Corallococcus sp. AB045]RKH90196.1 hypothetical protein D7Y21_07730 [Corallococcus sp. AB045]
MDIRKRIETAYLTKRSALFVPQQFIAAQVGPAKEVLTALQELVADHYLAEKATVVCAFGHEFWGGPPARAIAEGALDAECPVPNCPSHEFSDEERDDEETKNRVILRYSITRPWRESLDAQKKSLECQASR